MNRLTRSEKAAQSRQRVLEAAGKVFREKGYHGASLDEISDRAAFSKGVIYSQFGSKDELFLALMEKRMEWRVGQLLELARNAPQEMAVSQIWQQARKVRESDRLWSLAILEFRIHAARNPELNQRFRALHDKALEALAGMIEGHASRTGLDLQYKPEDFARFMAMLDSGGLLEELAKGSGDAYDLSLDAVLLLLNGSGAAAPDGKGEAS